MSDFLLLNKNYIQNGLGTLTYNVLKTGNYNVEVQATVQAAISSNQGAGSGRDMGLALGGSEGIGAVPATSLGQGGLGEGFGGTNAGAPATDAIALTKVSSALVITVLNGSTLLYTSPALAPTQTSLQFRLPLQAALNDVITVVLASANASDKTLQGIQANISIGEGL